MDTDAVTAQLRAFADERDWARFHTPRNLVLALVGEVGELAEVVQWRTDAEIEALLADAVQRRALEDELADVVNYALRLADVAGIDLDAAVQAKIAANARRYPADEVRGSAAKRPPLP